MIPKVSIVVTCFNESPEVLSRALASIIRQNYQNVETLVVDDSAKREFEVLVKERFPGFSYLSSAAHNNATALNKGMSRATGKYVAILDGDDEFLGEEKLSLQVDFLERNPEFAAVGTNIEICYPDGKTLHPDYSGKKDIEKNLMRESIVPHSSVMFRKTALETVFRSNEAKGIQGVYDERFNRGKDWDLFLSLGRVGKLGMLPYVGLRYYINESKKRFYDSKKRVLIILKHRGEYRYWFRALIIQLVRLCIFFFLEKIIKRSRA